MDWRFLLLDLVPLLVFVVVDSLSNMKYAIIGALLAAVLELGYSLYLFGEVDEFSMVSVLLILVFGGLSLRFDNPLFFKFKPVILSAVMALTLLVTYSLGRPLLLMAADRYGEMFPEQMRWVLVHPYARQILERASLYLGFGFLVHAGAVAWAALRLSNWWWFATRSVGSYVMVTIVVVLASR